MPAYQIINADIIEWSKGHEWLVQNIDGPFHFIFGDWPYNLASILKRFGSKKAAPAKRGTDGAFQRQSAGFMGQTWDIDLAYRTSTWQLLKGLLHPGGFTASFSHSRKFHKLMTAQEEAGFLINPTIDTRIPNLPLAWIYSTGKPNGTSVKPGLERRDHPLAEAWEGYQYGCPLTPEYEPIVIAQKAYDGKPVDSIAETGAGAYSIKGGKQFQTNGRFPGTVALVHHPGCIRVGYKKIKNGSGSVSGNEHSDVHRHVYGYMTNRVPYPAKGSNGYEMVPWYDCHPDCPVAQSPGPDKAHYFAQIDWTWEVLERLATINPYFYEAKVKPRERNAGCQGLPEVVRKRANSRGYANTDAWKDTIQHNPHPTLKPIKLAQYIASLFLPPKEYTPRRCLIPCGGTGSEAAGALLAGWDEVVMVEMMPQKPDDPDYCGLAEKRVGFFYEFVKYGQTDVDVILDSIIAVEEDRQLSLLDLEE